MPEKAVIDRIVDGEHAVLLVGEEEREMVVPMTSMPAEAREGMWLQIEFNGEKIISVELDEDTTTVQKDRIQKKMALLRERGRNRKN